MFLSLYFLKYVQTKEAEEQFLLIGDDSNDSDEIKLISSSGEKINFLLATSSYIFFILELILFLFALKIIRKCSRNKTEFLLNFIIALIFTTPYVFFSYITLPCAKDAFL
jgi:hypothetical protein